MVPASLSNDLPVVVGNNLNVVALCGSLNEPDASLGVDIIHTLKNDVFLTGSYNKRTEYNIKLLY